jgi:hypothetical protein
MLSVTAPSSLPYLSWGPSKRPEEEIRQSYHKQS